MTALARPRPRTHARRHTRGAKAVAWVAGTAALATAVAMTAAPAASAVAPEPCLGQTFLSNGYCTVADGETIFFTVASGAGGFGGAAYGAPATGGRGGLGGAAAQVTGFYTNTSGAVETLTVVVGLAGADGAAGTSGTPNGGFGLAGDFTTVSVQGGSAIVDVAGGAGGQGGAETGSPAPAGDGLNGNAGGLLQPNSLPTGWTQSVWAQPDGFVTFTAPAPPNDDAIPAAGPADLVQQVEIPASGSCADVKDADLKWGTDLTGGWHKAWGDWANRFVCSRTFHYGANGWEILAA